MHSAGAHMLWTEPRLRLHHTGNLLTFSAATAILPESGIGLTLMFNASSGTLAEQTAIFAGALNIIEGGHASPGVPQVSGKLLDSILAVLTVAAILLATRGVASSRRWAARVSPDHRSSHRHDSRPHRPPRAGRQRAQARRMATRRPRLHVGDDPLWLARTRGVRSRDRPGGDRHAGARAWQLGAVAPLRRPQPVTPQEVPAVSTPALSSFVRAAGRAARFLRRASGRVRARELGGSPDSR